MMKIVALASIAAGAAAAFEGTGSFCLSGDLYTELDSMSAFTSYNGNIGIASTCSIYKVCMTETVTSSVITTPATVPVHETSVWVPPAFSSVLTPTGTVTLSPPGPPAVVPSSTTVQETSFSVPPVATTDSGTVTTHGTSTTATATMTKPTHTTSTPSSGAVVDSLSLWFGFIVLVANMIVSIIFA